jgi:uncharacterized protein
MFNKINADLQKAMKDKDTVRLATLRMMKSKILNVNSRGDLPEAEIIKIVSKYAKSLKEAIEEARKVNRLEDAGKVEEELKIVEEYLPKQLSENEIKSAVEKIISELGATSMKDMGNVMKEIGAKHPGIDNKLVSSIVREKLGS